MNNFKLTAAAAVLTGLVAIKLLLPDAAGLAREATLDALVPDRDYRAVFETLSSSLSLAPEEEPPAPEAAETSEPEDTEAPAPEAPVPEEITESPVSEDPGTAQETEPGPEVPAAVAAFLDSQAEYSDYDLPENVDYEYLSLPFDYALPVSGYESSGFGYRLHPILNVVRFHYGTDFAANAGEDIHAFADGTVTFAGASDSYGNYITIDHGDGWTSLYAHCSYLYVQTGQRVSAGEKIALVGATGLATGPHLHFELKQDGVWHNPEYYVNT